MQIIIICLFSFSILHGDVVTQTKLKKNKAKQNKTKNNNNNNKKDKETYQNSRSIEIHHFWLTLGVYNGAIYCSSLLTVPRSFGMLFYQLSRDIRHLCGDRDPRTKVPLQLVFYLSLSRFSQFAYPVSVKLNEKMNCVSLIAVNKLKCWWGRFFNVLLLSNYMG